MCYVCLICALYNSSGWTQFSSPPACVFHNTLMWLTVAALVVIVASRASCLVEVALPAPNDRISFAVVGGSSPQAAIAVTPAELAGDVPCSFIADGPPGALALCGIEAGTQAVLAQYISNDSIVLESECARAGGGCA